MMTTPLKQRASVTADLGAVVAFGVGGVGEPEHELDRLRIGEAVLLRFGAPAGFRDGR